MNIITTAVNNLERVLQEETPIFDPQEPSIIQQRHPNYLEPTCWTIGSSLTEAKLLAELLPSEHVRLSVKSDDSGRVLAEVTEISHAGLEALLAWLIVGGDDIPAKLERCSSEAVSQHPAKGLFNKALEKWPAKFFNDYTILNVTSSHLKHPSRFKVFSSLEEAHEMAAALPTEHRRDYILWDLAQDTIIAKVVKVSRPSIIMLAAWQQCDSTSEIEVLQGRISRLIHQARGAGG